MSDDLMRATGRTTRMATEAVARSQAGVAQIIYCANPQEIKRIKRLFVDLGGNLESARFVTPFSRTQGMFGSVLWDHYAIDVWERHHLQKIREQADGIRRAQP